ncbi:unnamed protein product [Cylindrotheca closterium]|uniref:Uncharacterized protein n=1 Tax=Cylindrotheca closterium TaxID=2856 RepID=A0AAD2FGT5_9STRA|nr:unnamed protein product [Cylindrotheca closterium]
MLIHSFFTLELDTTEIIMNNEVKPPEESDFPRMHLAVQVGDNHIESPFHYSSNELTIAFVNPYTKDEFHDDLQFVMEVEGPAEFVDGGAIGCDGNKRLSARMQDASHGVQLKVNDMTSTLRLWAGWATGQESVRLTENLMLEPHHTPTGGSAEQQQQQQQRDLKDEVVAEEGNSEPGNHLPNGEAPDDLAAGNGLENSEPENPVFNEEEAANEEETNREIPNKDPSGKLDKIQQIKEQIKRFQDNPEDSLQKGDESYREEDNASGSEKKKAFHLDEIKEIMRKTHSHPVHHAMHLHKKVSDIGKKIHDKYLYDEEKQQSFRQQYESDEFAGRLDTQRHIFGSIFFLATMGYILVTYTRRRGTKGRRDL